VKPQRSAALLLISAWLLGLAVGGAAQGSSEEPVSPNTKLSIGVAPFERVGGVGPDVPDVAMMLARRLSTLGVERVVSPRDLGAPPAASPDAAEVAGWAQQTGVDTVVVGRTTALGRKLSIDARIHAGANGEAVGRRFFVEVPRSRDLPLAVQDLAGQVLEQAAAAQLPAVSAQSSPGSSDPAEREASPSSGTGAPAGGAKQGGFQKDAPISIHSDVLDVFEQGGEKRFVFKGHVRAEQADLVIRSQRLEAFYPRGRGQPHKIVASGAVTLRQEDRIAECETATFYRDDDRLVCVGNIAQVEQGCDVVRGREIIFHTASQELEVNGAADVRILPEEQCGAGGSGAKAAAGGDEG
jgi:lipopolysaccharide transport protein LptA